MHVLVPVSKLFDLRPTISRGCLGLDSQLQFLSGSILASSATTCSEPQSGWLSVFELLGAAVWPLWAGDLAKIRRRNRMPRFIILQFGGFD